MTPSGVFIVAAVALSVVALTLFVVVRRDGMEGDGAATPADRPETELLAGAWARQGKDRLQRVEEGLAAADQEAESVGGEEEGRDGAGRPRQSAVDSDVRTQQLGAAPGIAGADRSRRLAGGSDVSERLVTPEGERTPSVSRRRAAKKEEEVEEFDMRD